MTRKISVVVACAVVTLLLASTVYSAPLFVATAKNFRGALYLGYGPTPTHASEQAVVKCSQDSFIPPSCKVVCVRAECPPPCPPPKARKTAKVYKPISSSKYQAVPYPTYPK
ncbi:MAG: hypothetical protein FJ118_11645 [Deltaproteobacteria bacterium]|nr:hypothetical protein [Deltaproteobacteria bacterium]